MKERKLIDQYGRQLTYLRLSVTDRCNFRCYYCMPEEGMNFVDRKELLSFEELCFLSEIFCSLGVNKIRITGGEPFVRNNIINFIEDLSKTKGLDEITLTTNGSLPLQHIGTLKRAGVQKINISLDSLDPERFLAITRRDSFRAVYACIFKLLEEGFEIKLNCVLSASKNVDEILSFIELTKLHPIAVRFLEEMPFNGSTEFGTDSWTYQDTLGYIRNHYPEIIRLDDRPDSTSINFRIRGYRGAFGVIPSFSRTLCGTCNRIRLSATGELRTCLYGAPALNLRDMLRAGATQQEIEDALVEAVRGRARDGFEAERLNTKTLKDSMSVLGG